MLAYKAVPIDRNIAARQRFLAEELQLQADSVDALVSIREKRRILAERASIAEQQRRIAGALGHRDGPTSVHIDRYGATTITRQPSPERVTRRAAATSAIAQDDDAYASAGAASSVRSPASPRARLTNAVARPLALPRHFARTSQLSSTPTSYNGYALMGGRRMVHRDPRVSRASSPTREPVSGILPNVAASTRDELALQREKQALRVARVLVGHADPTFAPDDDVDDANAEEKEEVTMINAPVELLLSVRPLVRVGRDGCVTVTPGESVPDSSQVGAEAIRCAESVCRSVRADELDLGAHPHTHSRVHTCIFNSSATQISATADPESHI